MSYRGTHTSTAIVLKADSVADEMVNPPVWEPSASWCPPTTRSINRPCNTKVDDIWAYTAWKMTVVRHRGRKDSMRLVSSVWVTEQRWRSRGGRGGGGAPGRRMGARGGGDIGRAGGRP